MNLAGGFDQYGVPSQDIMDLTKALGSGQEIGGALGDAYVSGGAAFRVQSLEGILKIVTFQDKNIVFWKDIPKSQAFNTTEEYNVLKDYGAQGSGFMVEGGLPQEDTGVYERKAAFIKVMGTTGSVTQLATLTRSAHGDIIGREAKTRTMGLLQNVENALFHGDSSLNSLAFDGIEKQIVDANTASVLQQNVVDLRGAPLDEDTMENISRIVADNAGELTTLYASNQALTDLGKQILPNGRFSLPYGDKEGRLGYRVRHFDAQCGSFEMKPNLFLKAGALSRATAANGAPVTPAIVVVEAATSDATALFAATATQFYKAAAMNTLGESLAGPSASVSVVAGKRASITIAHVAGATSFKVYRGTTVGNMKEMVIVAAAAGSADTVVLDRNFDLPGTSKAYGVMNDGEQGLNFKQLAPLQKVDLATVAASYRFMILLYGMPIVYAPLKMVVIKNIGTL